MTHSIDPNDPHQPLPSDRLRHPVQAGTETQIDPQLAEGPASSSRTIVFGLGIAIVLGAVFYGLNNSATNSSGAQTTASQTSPVGTAPAKPPGPTNNIADSNPSKPPVAPGIRDVTPYNNDNNQPGVTTGSAPSRPQPQASAPTGTEVDRAKGGSN